MSIKTNKRLALGVIAALVFAPFAAIAPASAVAATATPFQVTAASFKPADSFVATAAVQQVAGANNFVQFASGIDGAAAVHVAKVTGGTFSVIANGTGTSAGVANAASTEITYADGNLFETPHVNSFRVATPTAGTITVVIATRATTNGVVTDTALQTFTITVLATAVTNVYSAANSTVLAEKAVAGTGLDNVTTVTTITDAAAIATPAIEAAAAADTVEVLAISIDQEDANDVNLTTAVKNEIAITPIGRVGIAANTPLGDYATETAQGSDFYVFADGRPGIATVTVSVNSVVVKTYTVKFYGAVASIVATSKVSSIDADDGLEAGVFEVLVSDAAGTPIPGITPVFNTAADATLVSTATSAATAAGTGKALVSVTPVATKYGTTTVTVKSGTIISNPITVVFAHNAIASATLAFDKTTYLPGEKAKLTMAAKDKNSLIVPDALTAATTLAFSTSLSTTSTFGTAPTFVAGAYAQDVFAPTNTTITTWSVSVKTAANAIFATAAQGVTFTATATVGIPPAPVVVPPVVYDNPTLSFVKDGGRVILSGTAVDGEGDIIIYTKKVGTTAWKERAKTLEVAAPGDFNGSIKAPKSNVLIRVKQEGTGQFSNQIIVLK